MDGTQVYLKERTDGKLHKKPAVMKQMRSVYECEASMNEKRRHEAEDKSKFLVAMRLGDTPVPIPNTMVKT